MAPSLLVGLFVLWWEFRTKVWDLGVDTLTPKEVDKMLKGKGKKNNRPRLGWWENLHLEHSKSPFHPQIWPFHETFRWLLLKDHPAVRNTNIHHSWIRLRQDSLLCIKQIANKDLRYSIGNYTQYLIITYNGKESEKRIYMGIYMYNWITLLYTWI